MRNATLIFYWTFSKYFFRVWACQNYFLRVGVIVFTMWFLPNSYPSIFSQGKRSPEFFETLHPCIWFENKFLCLCILFKNNLCEVKQSTKKLDVAIALSSSQYGRISAGGLLRASFRGMCAELNSWYAPLLPLGETYIFSLKIFIL